MCAFFSTLIYNLKSDKIRISLSLSAIIHTRFVGSFLLRSLHRFLSLFIWAPATAADKITIWGSYRASDGAGRKHDCDQILETHG